MQNYHAAGNPASNVPNLPFDQWADRWLWRVRLSVKPSSYTRYKNAVERHICPLLGRLDINQIQTRQLEAYAHEKLRAGRLDASGGQAPDMPGGWLRNPPRGQCRAFQTDLASATPSLILQSLSYYSTVCGGCHALAVQIALKKRAEYERNEKKVRLFCA